jgi:Na+-driven multidrug efflux pump
VTFAVAAGLSTSAALLAFGAPILGALGTSAESMAPALSYLSWRALATPAVLLMNVCQGVCLGQQDSATPLAVFASVGVANLLLDVVLILGMGLGCTGAGMATPVAQWAGALVFLNHLLRKVRAALLCSY